MSIRELNDAVYLRQELNRLSDTVRKLERAVRALQKPKSLTDTRNSNESTVSHTHNQYITSADVLTIIGDSLGNTEIQAVTGKIATESGDVLDLTSSNYKYLKMTVEVTAVSGGSAVVKLESSHDNTFDGEEETMAQVTVDTLGSIPIYAWGVASYVRYDIVVTGTITLSITLELQN